VADKEAVVKDLADREWVVRDSADRDRAVKVSAAAGEVVGEVQVVREEIELKTAAPGLPPLPAIG
jgi:uncharacterized protein YfiM (DUF2279 family)